MLVKLILSLLVSTMLISPEIRQDDDLIMGCDMRLINSATRDKVLKIIRFRISSGQAVEPMLVFSPYSDPDVLGSIAVDDTLSLEVREIAANAILDQLFEGGGYFQACSEHYLKLLINSEERALRFKGWIGEAIMEYWRFYSGAEHNSYQRMLRLKYSASREREPALRQELDVLSKKDPADFVGTAAWSAGLSSAAIYRKLDKVKHPAPKKLSGDAREIASLWGEFENSLKQSRKLNLEELTWEQAGARISSLLAALRKMNDFQLTGVLARVSGYGELEEKEEYYSKEFISYFKDIARRKSDPYLRSLALKPASYGNKFKAVDFLLDVMEKDQAPLVRLSAAELLKAFTDNSEVRTRIMAVYRTEEDYRVRLRILHSLARPFSTNLPRDVITFLINRLREKQEEIIMEYIVFALGNANVRSAYSTFSSLLASSNSVILRARIAESLARMGLGTRRRTLGSGR